MSVARWGATVRLGGEASIRSDAVLQMARDLPHAGTTVLVDNAGQIVYDGEPRNGFGSQMFRQGLAQSLRERLAGGYLARLLTSLPPDTLDPGQLLLLQTTYAVQAEGEHADIYYYAGRLLRDAQGELIGAIAVGHDRNPAPVPVTYKATLLGAVAALVLYWLSLPLWVWLDARSRGERAWLWAALAFMGNLVGVLTYLLARRPGRAACPGCGAGVRAHDNVCPVCGERLRAACPVCHAALEEGWRYCPRCASPVTE